MKHVLALLVLAASVNAYAGDHKAEKPVAKKAAVKKVQPAKAEKKSPPPEEEPQDEFEHEDGSEMEAGEE